MAINVNTVYTTVLSILNKEQRGYITPDEFNKTATQVQLEIFEKYFEDLNQQLRVPQTDNEYANRQLNLDTTMSTFKTSGNATSVPVGQALTVSLTAGGTGYTAQAANATTTSGVGTGLTLNTTLTTPTFTITTGGTGYAIGQGIATGGGIGNNLTVNISAIDANGVITGLLINNPGLGYNNGDVLTILTGGANATITLTSVSNGIIAGAAVTSGGSGYVVGDTINITGGGNNAVCSISSVNTELYFLPPSNNHRIGTVIYKDVNEIQRVDRNELLYLNLSPLTQPTTSFPVYLFEQASQGVSGALTGQSHIYVYPKTITSATDISVSYIRKPADVVWGFTIGTLGQYLYNQSTSTQFEINDTEQNEVILKILAYSGIIIRDPQIVQAASQQLAQEDQNERT
tara:strand:+ start:1112 stop:2317 length:1206 start_codon:yes stop_codon:yes gene_type:complete